MSHRYTHVGQEAQRSRCRDAPRDLIRVRSYDARNRACNVIAVTLRPGCPPRALFTSSAISSHLAFNRVNAKVPAQCDQLSSSYALTRPGGAPGLFAGLRPKAEIALA
jgi:hypothetical protein